jgi:copper(I)-binding protein
LLAAMALAALPALAHHDGEIFRAGDIRVSHVHTDEPAAAAHGIFVYLTVENTGETADRLISASVDFANPGRFQANVVGGDGTLRVREVRAIAVEPGQVVFLEPGGARIALDDVQRTIKAGDHFHMQLEFENAGPLEVEVEVEGHAEGEERHHHDEETAS